MSRSIVFCVILVLLTVAASIPTIPNDFAPVIFDFNPDKQGTFQLQGFSGWQSIFGDQDIFGKKDTSNVMDLFSSSQLIAVPSVSAQVEDGMHYTIGKRVPNDRIVSRGMNGGQWSSAVNVTLTLKYPTSGQGAKVTFAEFFVQQTSKIGRAVVKDGAIGQRAITIVVEADNTLYFAYKGLIYGI